MLLTENPALTAGSATVKEKRLYLTFDDGPSPEYTMELLDLLESYHIRASFFVVGRFAEENPQIIRHMADKGHLVGLHSLEHISAYLQPPGYRRRDFEDSIEILKGLGITPRFYRPPWGHTRGFTRKLAAKYGLKLIYWDVMAEDWKGGVTAEEIAGKLRKRTAPGHIICLHDGRGKKGAPGRTIEALRQVLPSWLQEGYQFFTVNEADCDET